MQGRHYYIEQEGQREVKTVLGDMGNYTPSKRDRHEFMTCNPGTEQRWVN